MLLSRFVFAPVAFAAALVASPAFAGVQIIVGDTTNSPTFNRPVETLDFLSGVGTDVHFDAFSFSVSVSGDYTFGSLALPLSSPVRTRGVLLVFAEHAEQEGVAADAGLRLHDQPLIR